MSPQKFFYFFSQPTSAKWKLRFKCVVLWIFCGSAKFTTNICIVKTAPECTHKNEKKILFKLTLSIIQVLYGTIINIQMQWLMNEITIILLLDYKKCCSCSCMFSVCYSGKKVKENWNESHKSNFNLEFFEKKKFRKLQAVVTFYEFIHSESFVYIYPPAKVDRQWRSPFPFRFVFSIRILEISMDYIIFHHGFHYH